MTDFLTRLIARAQGAIPSAQLAQPLLNSTFAPKSMGVESPIEMYEERDANPVTSPFAKRPTQERSHAKPQTALYSASQAELPTTSSIEGQVVEAFEKPAITEPTSRPELYSSQAFQRQQHQGVQGEQDEEHQSIEENVEGQTNQDISYSHKSTESQLLPVSTSLPSLHPQTDSMNALQTDAIAQEQDASLVSEHGSDIQESKEDLLGGQELLVEVQQPTLTTQQQITLSSSTSSDTQRNGGKFEEIEEFTLIENEADLPKEQLQMSESRQQANELLLPRQTMDQDAVQGLIRGDNGQDVATVSRHELEAQEELLIAPQSSTQSLRSSSPSSLFASPTPVLSEQERIERVEVVHPLLNDVARELVSREEVERVQRGVTRKEQAQVVEHIHEAQSRRSGDLSPRRIIPTQVHVTHQERGAAFSAKEPMTPSVTPQTPPTIQVSIGRIEVRAVTAPTPAPRPKPVRPSPSLSLEEYLKQQRGGR